MINLLAKYFIKNNQNTQDPNVRQAYGVLCGAVGIFLNLLLFTGKFLAGLASGSIAITADAFNNLSDAGSSIITLIGFRMAGQKPDPEHPFGHGRIEYISGFLVSIAILLMGLELLKTSAEKILHPGQTVFSPLIMLLLVASILVKVYMYLYNRSVGRRIGSTAMSAAAADSLSDSLATAVVLACALVSRFTQLSIDGWCGVLVGLFILYTGFQAAKETISPLLGQPPEPEFVRQIERIVLGYDEVLGIHDLIVHNYGPGRVMISLHAEVPASGDILKLHDMIDCIEQRLRREMQCEAVIHMDPVMNDDAETKEFKELAERTLHAIDGQLHMHDFRIVKGPTHTNLIFDVVTPFNYKYSDKELRELIERAVQQKDPRLFAVIQVDKDYTA